jgi:hypothetical protein
MKQLASPPSTLASSIQVLLNSIINKSGDIFLVCLYVNDFIIIGKKKILECLKNSRKQWPRVWDNRFWPYVLLSWHWSEANDGRHLYLSRKVMLKKFQMDDCKPMSTSVEYVIKLSRQMEKRWTQNIFQIRS